jgi:hypothetical protein
MNATRFDTLVHAVYARIGVDLTRFTDESFADDARYVVRRLLAARGDADDCMTTYALPHERRRVMALGEEVIFWHETVEGLW